MGKKRKVEEFLLPMDFVAAATVEDQAKQKTNYVTAVTEETQKLRAPIKSDWECAKCRKANSRFTSTCQNCGKLKGGAYQKR